MAARSSAVKAWNHEAVLGDASDDAASLRQLLLAEERRRLDFIEQRLSEYDVDRRDLERRTKSHSEVLVDSLRLAAEQGDELSDALRPEVELGLRRSIRENPEVMADALYPVLGPAVRKLVASLFQPAASGKAQPYRVEQLFLIHRETGLVLAHTAFDEKIANDADVVSGMLDAIRSFVQDAFSAPDHDGMQTLKVGDITVWVEWGPQAVLAVVVRGFAPETLREICAETLRTIHLEHGTVLEGFDGDNAAFDSLSADLESAIKPVSSSSTDSKTRIRWLSAGVLITVFASAIWFSNVLFEKREWERLLNRLNATPGIVVVEASRDGDVTRLTALRDPLANSPDNWLNNSALANVDIQTNWVPYISLDSEIILRRVQTVLKPAFAQGAVLHENVLLLSNIIPTNQRDALTERLLTFHGIERVTYISPDQLSDFISDNYTT